MTNKEREILEFIIQNPSLKQNEIADALNQSRVSIAVHISNLIKQDIIKGRHYIINYDKLEENKIQPTEQKLTKKDKLVFIGNLSKYISYTKNDINITQTIEYTSYIFKFMEYVRNIKQALEIEYITNITPNNSFYILQKTNELDINIKNSFYTHSKDDEYICINNDCDVLTANNNEITLSNYNLEEIIIDDSISFESFEIIKNKNIKLNIFIENNVELFKNILNSRKNNINILVVNYNILLKQFKNTDIEFLKFKLYQYNIPKLYIIQNDKLLVIDNKNVVEYNKEEEYKIIFNEVFK